MVRNEFLKRLDDYMLELNLDYHYNRLMNREISLEERARYNELYEALTIEQRFRKNERTTTSTTK